jgi:phosphohistidine swiveling domain-containing protein
VTLTDPVDHLACDPDVSWTSGNVAEAFPGVCTPLGFSFMHDPVELALRRAFRDIGALTTRAVAVPEHIEDQYWSVFGGRAAANMDRFRDLADRVPGTSARAIEQQLFGYVRPGTVDHNTYRRYPAIAIKAPLVVAGLTRRHDALFASLRAWRTASLENVASLDPAGCRKLMVEARRRFEDIMVMHFLATFVSSGVVDRVVALGSSFDVRLLTAVGSDENDVAADLWALAHGALDMATFLDRHGYHGPSEGQLDVVSWREDCRPIEARLDAYRAIDADDPRAPHNRRRSQTAERDAALAALTAPMGRIKTAAVRRLVRLAGRLVALREQGKAGYLMCFDVARAASRRLGDLLADGRIIETADDVFFLTWDEMIDTPPAHSLIVTRRGAYEERRRWRLPESWTGVPELIRADVSSDEDDGPTAAISGLGAGSGVVEGRARVVRDPGTTELESGDILVCEATDPSWIALFMVAGGVVTDLGGLLSHGAIVAREMGLPCVVGTKAGTRRIRDGQRLRVDGDRGLVEILS